MTRTILRFGRVYTEFDPDGIGGGPSTWILSEPGAGSGGGSSDVSGTFNPATEGAILKTGMAVYLPATGQLDLAVAGDGAGGGGVEPFRVIGLAAVDATGGQPASVNTDGQLRLVDWTPVCGTELLQAGRTYFLSAATPGRLQVTPPQGTGVTVVSVGRAVDPNTLEIEIDVLVRL